MYRLPQLKKKKKGMNCQQNTQSTDWAEKSDRKAPDAEDLRELPRVPLRGEGSCGGGGAPRDSAGSGATEEAFHASQNGCNPKVYKQ